MTTRRQMLRNTAGALAGLAFVGCELMGGLPARAQARRVIPPVELGGKHTRGQTTVDWFGLGGETANTDVVLELDDIRFWEMLRASVG